MMSAGPRSTLGGSDSAREDESAPYNGNQDQQLSLTFWAFKENRIHFFVQVKDTMQNSSASGRLQIYSSGRSHLKALRSESELLQQHICTLNLNLPSIHSPTLENGSEPGCFILQTNILFVPPPPPERYPPPPFTEHFPLHCTVNHC